MKKRILSLALALVLVASVLPVNTYAEGTENTAHVHCMCGAEKALGETCAECGETAVEWTAWTAANITSAASGNYYLTDTLTVSSNSVDSGEDIALCLAGNNIESGNGTRIALINGALTIADCTEDLEEVGMITGCNAPAQDGMVFTVNTGGTLKLYNGKITQNESDQRPGVIAVKKDAAFYMYGGEISNNKSQRGAVYTATDSNTTTTIVQILGGKITENTGTNSAASTGGGAGIYAFCKVVVGGNAVISGNHGSVTSGTIPNENIYLRNDASFLGSLKLSEEVPLCQGAQIDFGVNSEGDSFSLSNVIEGTPTNWSCGWLSYNGQDISYHNNQFVLGHFHNGVEYTAWDTIPSGTITSSNNGNYYLTADVERTSVIPITDNVELTLCLNGHDVTLTNGSARLLGFAGSNSVVTVEDCSGYYDAETQTYVSGALSSLVTIKDSGAVVQVGKTNTFVLDGAQISGVTNTIDTGAPVFVGASDATSVATFRMESGAICGNTVVNGGAIYVGPGTGEGSIVDINGGYIYGNSTTNGGAIYLAGKARVTIDDAVISGNTADTGGAVYIGANAEVEITETEITGNTAAKNGVVYVSVGLNGASGGTFTMNSGKLSGNTSNRGAVYTAFETDTSKNPVDPVVRILGGTITGNTGTGTGGVAGGAGIYAFCPVEIGGNAQIYGNTAADSVDDIYLRNDGTFTGKLIVSKEVPLTQTANIHYGTKTAETAMTGLAYICASDDEGQLADIQTNNLTYVNKKLNVYYTETKGFYLAPAKVGDTCYPTAAAAMNASSSDAYAVLLADSAETVTATKNVYVDLNGHDVSAVNMGAYTLYGMDSVTNDYDSYDEETSAREYGAIGTLTGGWAGSNVANGKTYVGITEDAIGTSFHRVYVSIYSTLLRTANNGVGFKARYAADEAVTKLINGDTGSYGINFNVDGSLNEAGTDVDSTYTFTSGLLNTTPNKLLVAITQILSNDEAKPTEGDELIKRRAERVIIGKAYLQIGDIRIEGNEASTSLKALVEAADRAGAAVGSTAIGNIDKLVKQYSAYFTGLGTLEYYPRPAEA